MLYKVLVADDEELERRALRHIIGGCQEPGAEISEAANGLEVMEKIGRTRFDAVFLDIRMPGMDGIRTAQLIREKYPHLPIIFLTAHDNFEYARSALRLKVEDFLLKPASADEVLSAFRHAVSERSDMESDSSMSVGEGTSRLKGALDFMAGEIRSGLASGLVDCVKMERYVELSGNKGRVIAVIRMKPLGPASSLSASASISALTPIVERGFDIAGVKVLAGAGREFVTGIIAVGTDAPSSETDKVIRYFEVKLRDDLLGIVAKARTELGLSTAAGAAMIAHVQATRETSGPEALVGAARRACAIANSGNPVIVVGLSAPFDTSLVLNPGGHPMPAGDRFSASGSASANPVNHSNPVNAVGKATAQRALELMEERHADDLSLESVAQELSVSPSHLSRLLGRHAGMGFAECLSRFRVEKSRQYLSSGSCSIKEASFLSGFRDPAYFARVFRKFTGMSPGEYAALGTASLPDPGKER